MACRIRPLRRAIGMRPFVGRALRNVTLAQAKAYLYDWRATQGGARGEEN